MTIIAQDEPFGSPSSSIETMIANLFLVQSLGFFNENSWNFPSWSISVEFYTYLLFAFAILIFKQNLSKALLITAITICAGFFISSYNDINVTSDAGLYRCIMGFSVGVLTYKLQSSIPNIFRFKFGANTALEVVSIISIFLFITYLGETKFSFFAPFLFSLVVLVFARENGAISKALRLRPFLTLGTLSYSIYMTHALFQLVLINIAKIIDKKFGTAFITEEIIDGKTSYITNTTLLEGDVWQIAAACGVVILSWFTYKLIEVPFNNIGRKYVFRRRERLAMNKVQSNP